MGKDLLEAIYLLVTGKFMFLLFTANVLIYG